MAIYGRTAHSAEDLVLEQVRTLTRRGYHPTFHDDNTPPDDEKSCMLLVMRVLSIVPLNFKVIIPRHFYLTFDY